MPFAVIVSAGADEAVRRTLASVERLGAEVLLASAPGFAGWDEAARRATAANLAFLEAGVVVAPGTLEALEAALAEGVAAAVPSVCIEAAALASAGRRLVRTRMSRFSFDVAPRRAGEPYDERAPDEDVAVTSSACIVTSRRVFTEAGGFDDRFSCALADVDFSLRLHEVARRIVCVRRARAIVAADHRGLDDALALPVSRALLEEVWRERIDAFLPDPHPGVRETRVSPERYVDAATPPRVTTVFVHGPVPDLDRLRRSFAGAGAPIARIVWNSPDPPFLEVPVEVDRRETTAAAIAAMELRGDRAIAFVDGRCSFGEGWLAVLTRELSWGADVVAATFADAPPPDGVVPACDGRATLLALADIPAHLRLDRRLELDAALIELSAKLRACGLAVRCTASGGFVEGIETDRLALDVRREPPALRPDGLASIIMLSWNAPNYTKIALDSIREHTHHPYEVIIVDNGSDAETTDWLRTLEGVHVIYNPSNRGFAGGNNQGIVAAKGEYVVVLNNDVVVTEGWLEGMIDALQRNPLTGISAPRSNRVAGIQQLPDANYPDVKTMHEYAAARRQLWRKTGFFVERAIGFCLCIDRRVLDEIGGIDERFGAGNFEDDDFCIRARAAGYKIYVCDDVFIHHFGSVTFSANKVDWQASMSQNWVKFAKKWGLPHEYPASGYLPAPIIARGFERAAHYVALPAAEDEAPAEAGAPPRREVAVRVASIVRNEADWSSVGAFVRRFSRAFEADADVALHIAACGTIDASTLGDRVLRLIERNGLDAERVADIEIDDIDDVEAWLTDLRPATMLRVQKEPFGGTFDGLPVVEETSPSALRRALVRWKSPA